MSKKIAELELHNFKFFTAESEPLKFDGKHMLIWGENGSGKSSIYWAIYTLLQCSFKDAAGIDDYFTYDGPKNLININAANGDPAFVRLQIDDAAVPEYRIEHGNGSIIGNVEAQLSAVSSDFIDYNVVASFLRFYHKHDPWLFTHFYEDIFRFIPFAPPAAFVHIVWMDKAWEELRKGLQRHPTGASGKLKYPSRDTPAYANFASLTKAFNEQLAALLGLVTTKANQLLETKFGYPIELELRYTPYAFQVAKSNSDFVADEPEITLFIRKYYGKDDIVKKPHSFLNEAKKTAIGLAIRLAILDRRLNEDRLNILALDDLLISLDMSNREVVLNLLFNEYQPKYQLLIFTHDRQFFEIAKHKIEFAPYKKDWQFWEFYVDERDPNNLKPRLFENETELSIARKHLLNNDYPAAANYLRKHCENLIERFLPPSCYADIEKKESNRNHTLDSSLNKSLNFLSLIHQPVAKSKFIDLKQYLQLFLNPLSHTERGIERYKGEIKNVVNILEDLQQLLAEIKFKQVIGAGDEIILTLQQSPDVILKFQIRLKEDLYSYWNGTSVVLAFCLVDSKHVQEFTKGVETNSVKYEWFANRDLPILYRDITNHAAVAVPEVADWPALFANTKGDLLSTVMQLPK